MEEKNIRKIISLLLILMIPICVLTACGIETESPDSTQAETSAISQEPTSNDDSKDPSGMARLRKTRDELRKIKDLEEKNEALVAVYNEIAKLAVENGWEADAETLKFIKDADAVIKTFNGVISKPFSADGADLDEMLSLADDLKTELDTTIREKVSMPYGGDITQADVDEYTGLLDKFLPILTDIQALVAVPAK